MGRIVRSMVGVVLAVVLLVPLVAAAVLYAPPLQEVAVEGALAWVARRTGTSVGVQRVSILFPLRIEVEGLRVGGLAEVGALRAELRVRPLARGVVEADCVRVSDIAIHGDGAALAGFTAALLRADGMAYRWGRREGHVRRVLLADARVTLQGRAAPPTATPRLGRLPLSIDIGRATLLRTGVTYTDGQVALQGVIGRATLCGVAADTAMSLSLLRAAIGQGELVVNTPRMAVHCSQLAVQADSLHYGATGAGGRVTRLAFREARGMALSEGALTFAWHEGALSIPHLALGTAHSSLLGRLHMQADARGAMRVGADADLHIGYADAMLLGRYVDGVPGELLARYPAEALRASIAVEGTRERLRVARCRVALPTAFDIAMSGGIQGWRTPRRCTARCSIEARTYDLSMLAPLMGDTPLRIPQGMVCRGDIGYDPDTLHARCTFEVERGGVTIEAGYRPTSRSYALRVEADSLDMRHIAPDTEVGMVSLRGYVAGRGVGHRQQGTALRGAVQVGMLQWGRHTLTHASAQAAIVGRCLQAHVACHDPHMRWRMASTVDYGASSIDAQLQLQVDDLDLQALGVTRTDIRPALRCRATLHVDSGAVALKAHVGDIALSTPTQHMHPRALDIEATLTTDTALLTIGSGDLLLEASAHTEGLPWQWQHSGRRPAGILWGGLSAMQATLSAGDDNPISNYMALAGVDIESIGVAAHYANDTLHAQLQSGRLTWRTPQMTLQGRAGATLVWGAIPDPDALEGTLQLSDVHYSLPAYNLQLHTEEPLTIGLERGALILAKQPVYTTGRQPLLLDGRVALFGNKPTVQLHLAARNTQLLQAKPTRQTLLYGKAVVSGDVALSGPLDALSVTGDLQLRPNSTIHYTYKSAMLTASNQLDNVVTFVGFDTDTLATTATKAGRAKGSIAMNLRVDIDPTTQIEVALGESKQNNTTLQGGGVMNLQYNPATGLRLSGRYTIERGELNMNVPLLHVSHMAIRTGSTITWEGNPLNPQLNITAEDNLRASVTLDGTPQPVLFVAGVSLTDTMEKLNVQFTLAAPENAAMQNMLATLSPEERGKLAVALLTTGLYLGEGGTGKLMNTALMGMLQAQIDNISRDAFRTVDVSVGIEPLPDGVSGVSTRTDYSFSIAKRLWNNRIRIIIGGSVTTSNERIEEDAVIDNISIEWRITPTGNQYLRLFYDRNYESILEGEIREMGVGYAFRKSF